VATKNFHFPNALVNKVFRGKNNNKCVFYFKDKTIKIISLALRQVKCKMKMCPNENYFEICAHSDMHHEKMHQKMMISIEVKVLFM